MLDESSTKTVQDQNPSKHRSLGSQARAQQHKGDIQKMKIAM